ncbi:MOSC domain-containing protein [Methylophilus sp. 'Pure River']|uniref:MOSC domain-containing protein n=1 Tax=Methylophilus sp. 'Pure River' TaxID=3377117 RepID=UPI00398F7537
MSTIAELWRYPVKSMLGEQCEALCLESRGVVGDRQYAIRDAFGKLGSGKNTRRFRKIDGLLAFSARYSGDVPELFFPSGGMMRGDAPALNESLSATLGQHVMLSKESDISHLDAGPVHLITSASLHWLQAALPDEMITARRFRPNIVIQWPGAERVEERWIGKEIRLGREVRLLINAQTERCGMVAFAQGALPEQPGILRKISQLADLKFGIYAQVITPGIVRVGDEVSLHA